MERINLQFEVPAVALLQLPTYNCPPVMLYLEKRNLPLKTNAMLLLQHGGLMN